ncbi:hypothetical protein BOX15_Mlig029293g1 [Macrostomum lignano]|uniref:LIM zinc-binding domain-containing protein n=1 Tax=Macrostomum lignano TaxID=282301 RepID=A0A267G9W1_9PLAT|nr:hypothetical protein BOX15_Mlig029293g1 [Macrostomum lignano]
MGELEAAYDSFVSAGDIAPCLAAFNRLCELLDLNPCSPDFFRHQLAKRRSGRHWRAGQLLSVLHQKASAKDYASGAAAAGCRALVIGGGPCGLRTAIELALLGARVTVLEKRDRFSRNNVLHLWPFLIEDLKALGAKKLAPHLFSGPIDHISIKTLQCILLKIALLLGVDFLPGVGFEGMEEVPPSAPGGASIEDNGGSQGFRCRVDPPEHPVARLEFNVLIGADGKRNTLPGFRRKVFRGKLAIAITANFIKRGAAEESQVQEISGFSYIYNQKYFNDLRQATGIDLENIVYYRDDTHYFVMTAKKASLIHKGVLLRDYDDPSQLLSQQNVDQDKLKAYAVEAATYATGGGLANMEFAANHCGSEDVAMFDFTELCSAENSCQIVHRRGQSAIVCLVGDSLLEPFWPTGSGCARGFLGALDCAWLVKQFCSGRCSVLEAIAERESVYQLLSQTTPETVSQKFDDFGINPSSRYPAYNKLSGLKPDQVRHLFDSDMPELGDKAPVKFPYRDVDQPYEQERAFLRWLQTRLSRYGQTLDAVDDVDPKQVLCILNTYLPNAIHNPDMAVGSDQAMELARTVVRAEVEPRAGASVLVPELWYPLSAARYLYQVFRHSPSQHHHRHSSGDKSSSGGGGGGGSKSFSSHFPGLHALLKHRRKDRHQTAAAAAAAARNEDPLAKTVIDSGATSAKRRELERLLKSGSGAGQQERSAAPAKQPASAMVAHLQEKLFPPKKSSAEKAAAAVAAATAAESEASGNRQPGKVAPSPQIVQFLSSGGAGTSADQQQQPTPKRLDASHPGVEKLSKMSAAGAGVGGQAGLEKCFFCDTTVYAAERRSVNNDVFHMRCFRCQYPGCGTALRMSAFARDPETRRFLCPSHHAEVLADLETRSIVMRWLEAHHGGGGLGEEGLAAKAGHLYLSPDEADGLMSAPGAAAAPMSPSSVTSASVSSQPSGVTRERANFTCTPRSKKPQQPPQQSKQQAPKSPSTAAGGGGGGGGDGNPLGFAEDQVEKVVLRGSESSEEGASKKDRRRLSGGAVARQHRRHHHPLSEEATSSSHGQLGPADFSVGESDGFLGSDEASSCEEDFEAAAAAAGLGDSEDRDNVFAMDAAKELQIRALMEARLLKRPKKADRQVRDDNQSTSSSEAAAAAAVAAVKTEQDKARVKLLQAMEITRRWNQTAPEPSGESLNAAAVAAAAAAAAATATAPPTASAGYDTLKRLRKMKESFFSQESKGLSLHTQFIAQRNLQMLRNSEVDDMPQEVAVDLNLDADPTKARQLMHQVATPGSSERLDDSFDYVFAEADLHDGNVDTASDEFLASLESARREIQRRRADREAALDAAELAAGRPHQIKHAPSPYEAYFPEGNFPDADSQSVWTYDSSGTPTEAASRATSGRATPVLDRMLEQNLAMMPIFTTNAAAATAATISSSSAASKAQTALLSAAAAAAADAPLAAAEKPAPEAAARVRIPAPADVTPSQTQPQPQSQSPSKVAAQSATTAPATSTAATVSSQQRKAAPQSGDRVKIVPLTQPAFPDMYKELAYSQASLNIVSYFGGGPGAIDIPLDGDGEGNAGNDDGDDADDNAPGSRASRAVLDTDLESSDDDDDIGGRYQGGQDGDGDDDDDDDDDDAKTVDGGSGAENDDFDDEGRGAKPPATATAMSPPPPMQLSGMIASPSGLTSPSSAASVVTAEELNSRRQQPSTTTTATTNTEDDGDDNDSQYDDVKVEGEAEAQPSAQGGGRLKKFFKPSASRSKAKKKRKLTKAQREQQQQQQQQKQRQKKSSGTSNGESGAARDKNATTSETEHSDTPTPDAVPASRRHQPQQQQQQQPTRPSSVYSRYSLSDSLRQEIDSLLPDSVPGSEKRDEAGKELREKISRAQARTAEVEAERSELASAAASGQAIDNKRLVALVEEKDALLRLEFELACELKELELLELEEKLLDCFRRLMSLPQSERTDHHDSLERGIVRMRLDVTCERDRLVAELEDLRLREADADAAKADILRRKGVLPEPEDQAGAAADLIRQGASKESQLI